VVTRVLERISRTGTTVLMATHNDAIVNTMRRRVIELDGGIVVRDQDEGAYDAPEAPLEEVPDVVSASVGPTSAGVEGLR
jgi:ABC-type polar amino acid transport system ATPase subunit